jgi:uncharacterized membrane protein YeiH
MNKIVPEPTSVHLYGICGAIADLIYDQDRHICPEEIYASLAMIALDVYWSFEKVHMDQLLRNTAG